jgi:hypothetical protein
VGAAGGGETQERSQDDPFVGKDADVTARLAQRQCPVQRLQCGSLVAGALVGQSLEHLDLDQIAAAALRLGMLADGREEPEGKGGLVVGEKEPRMGQVFGLAFVGGRQVGVEVGAVEPAAGGLDLAKSQPEPRLVSADGPHRPWGPDLAAILDGTLNLVEGRFELTPGPRGARQANADRIPVDHRLQLLGQCVGVPEVTLGVVEQVPLSAEVAERPVGILDLNDLPLVGKFDDSPIQDGGFQKSSLLNQNGCRTRHFGDLEPVATPGSGLHSHTGKDPFGFGGVTFQEMGRSEDVTCHRPVL